MAHQAEIEKALETMLKPLTEFRRNVVFRTTDSLCSTNSSRRTWNILLRTSSLSRFQATRIYAVSTLDTKATATKRGAAQGTFLREMGLATEMIQ